jgi:transcriptional regulator with XRE-family HTH domain
MEMNQPAEPLAAVVTATVGLRLAEQLRRGRDEHALSLHALSASAEVDRKYLRQLEAGQLNPTLKTLERLARALGTNVASLIGPPGTDSRAPIFPARTLVALNIKRLRRARHWSTADAQERLQMKAAYLSFVETGKNNVTLQTLCRIATGFGVDVVELLTVPGNRTGEMKKPSAY